MASGSRPSVMIHRRFSRALRKNTASDFRCSPISDSAVIRRFGIFNTNIAPGLRAHGVPHPVDYLVAPDGIVIRKYFVAELPASGDCVGQSFCENSDRLVRTLRRSLCGAARSL